MELSKSTLALGTIPRPTLRRVFRGLLKIATDAIPARFARRKPILYDSADQSINGTIYYPENHGRTPAVLRLHTAGGLTPHEHAIAARLAREGYTTLVITHSKRTAGAVLEDDQTRKQLEQITLDGFRFLQPGQALRLTGIIYRLCSKRILLNTASIPV